MGSTKGENLQTSIHWGNVTAQGPDVAEYQSQDQGKISTGSNPPPTKDGGAPEALNFSHPHLHTVIARPRSELPNWVSGANRADDDFHGQFCPHIIKPQIFATPAIYIHKLFGQELQI